MEIKDLYKNLLFFLIFVFVLITISCNNNTEKKLPKLIDLGSKKCVPCKKMAPILEELTVEYKGQFEVEFIDVWLPENKEKGKTYGIKTIPTQIFYDSNNNELWRHEGFLSKENILSKWKELGYSFTMENK